MFECLYGYTPFACEDRHSTKLKILKHKQTLAFPAVPHPHEPSQEALDLMMQLLVEKEKRLCSRKYHLNDYTIQMVGSRAIRFPADKRNQNYQGYFVYPDDADDLKRHHFFKHIQWDTLLHKRPPFVPKVKDWEDTKYFDEDQPISDIDEASSSEDEVEEEATKENCVPVILSGSKASQHHQEDQHIVPSIALKPSGTVVRPMTPISKPLSPRPSSPEALVEKVQGSPLPPETNKPAKQKKRDKKRPRDKILRDREFGKAALQLRKNGAFMGYSYRRPTGVEEVLKEVCDTLPRVHIGTSANSSALATSPHDVDGICGK
ncbi:uncharacterized protein HMPREF1541_05397 [Cyphellophora europaea CBS 101466]|uniref:non-specific serine/threonine protein kinase n=1 Tax=Cyphellophora europaea (strain CBS 101466) TaxID=1220924 RepID=W2RTX3_CYPE1|nr:uncharacterized protein HMPREF1541_05397 [Cyphellophora europaea CBS 101466]ETN39174.1 hypothetical protein HMPREF1541_05397 [Cyphellophora europaea CBS 101466]